jgi:S1-C subfamily serine protease
MTGSGFVAADDLIVTNAHVVAGVDTPVVELPGRDAREGRVVYFDPIDDLAVIAVGGLGAAPLPVVPPVAAGAAVAVQGYPLGGPFTSGAAFVLSVGSAPVPDIYDQSSTPREIYALDADVRPGNSGGPLLTDAGEVAGVVFARGADDERRGYAMTTTELLPVLAGVSADAPAVQAGSCTR